MAVDWGADFFLLFKHFMPFKKRKRKEIRMRDTQRVTLRHVDTQSGIAWSGKEEAAADPVRRPHLFVQEEPQHLESVPLSSFFSALFRRLSLYESRNYGHQQPRHRDSPPAHLSGCSLSSSDPHTDPQKEGRTSLSFFSTD